MQADIKLWPFKVVSDGSRDDKPVIEVYYQNDDVEPYPRDTPHQRAGNKPEGRIIWPSPRRLMI